MSDDMEVTALLHHAADRFEAAPPPPIETFAARARRRRSAQGLAAGAAVVIVVLISLIAAATTSGGHNTQVETRPPVGLAPAATVFGSATGDAVVFDDGGNGVATVDLDTRTVAVQAIVGQQAGDQPWRLTTSGSDLIVGWGNVYAAPLGGGPSRLLGAATVSLPAAEANDVWLATWAGGAIGQGTLSVSEVTTTGRVIVPPTVPGLGSDVPLVGIPHGLAFQSTQGLMLWDAATNAVTETLGSGEPEAGLPDGAQLAWCETDCTVLHVSNLVLDGEMEVSPPAGTTAFQAQTARFSPDGRYLAVVAVGPRASSFVVVDTVTGTSRIVADAVAARALVGWAPGGDRLFFASQPTSDPGVTLGSFTVANGKTQTAQIPVQLEGNAAMVVVALSQAHGLLPTFVRTQEGCMEAELERVPLGAICGYRF